MELPKSGTEDIQVSAEYITNAIRSMHAQAGRQIDIIGHSQGGMAPRWSLKWWPDTRAMVDDLVALTPSSQGTHVDNCLEDEGCTPAVWQQSAASDFMTALNTGQQTFAGVDYTVIATTLDELITPYQRSFLPVGEPGGGAVRNVVVQDHCPATPVDHFLAMANNAAYAVALDALDHDGVTSYRGASYAGGGGDRTLDLAECGRFFMPGVNLQNAPKGMLAGGYQTLAATTGLPGAEVAASSQTEPAVRDYARK